MNKEVTHWHGCYDDSWKGLITDEAFAHPAKFAPGLIQRILSHGMARGWWKVGDTIGDPFGGIAGGGIMAGYAGLNWRGVELEERFVGLGRENIALNAVRMPGVRVELTQGDSRRFAEIVSAGAVITSPPYGDTAVEKNSTGIDRRKQWENYRKGGGGSSWEKYQKQQEKHSQGYGNTPGNIAALPVKSIVTSPPFRDARSDTTKSQPTQHGGVCADRHNTTQAGAGYGQTAGQIDNLSTGDVDAVVTSPPYESQEMCGPRAGLAAYDAGEKRPRNYGSTAGQIGGSETYWTAMHAVYAQCGLALPAGGIMAVVVKDYVKNKARVPLCDQTLQLLESLGFTLVERIHAMLIKDTTHHGLFSTETKRTSRKSFFRRLAEKNGSPPIDFEEVIIVRAGMA